MNAQAASDEVERCMCQSIEPFGCVGWEKQEEAIGYSLSPVRVLRICIVEIYNLICTKNVFIDACIYCINN